MLVGDESVFSACGGAPAGSLIQTKAAAHRQAGKPDSANVAAVIEAIETSVRACLSGEAAALVTAPIHKAVLTQGGFGFPGHTEFLSHLTGARRAVMMLAGQISKWCLLRSIFLSLVAATIDKASIFETGDDYLTALRRDFGILNPRLAGGLNPDAGEDGVLGDEDAAIIAPAVAALAARGFAVKGPYSADTLFHAEARERYDAALCMYHDQALIPIKTLSFWDGVNVTLGLPIVRTSPYHGTALDIAGSGKADTRSMIAAIRMAAQMADMRARHG